MLARRRAAHGSRIRQERKVDYNMLIHEFDSVAGPVSRPSEEAIERDRQSQLAYVRDLIQRLTENQQILRVVATRQVVAA